MARVFGRPGRFTSHQATRLKNLQLTVLMLIMSAALTFIGYSLGRNSMVWIVTAFLPFLVSCWVLMRLTDRWQNQVIKDRQKYLRGEQAEEFVGWLLEDLDDRWHVFHGVQLQSNHDLDHVVVGPGGVYYISTKYLRGLISLDAQGNLLCNNRPTDLAHKTLREVMQLRERLIALLGTNELFVNAVLAVPFAWVDLTGPHKNVWILHRDNLVQTIASSPKRLSEIQVKAHVKAMEMLAGTALEVRNIATKAGFTASATRHKRK